MDEWNVLLTQVYESNRARSHDHVVGKPTHCCQPRWASSLVTMVDMWYILEHDIRGCIFLCALQPKDGKWQRRERRMWVRSRNCGCLVTWFCYQLIAKPGNKTAPVPWLDPCNDTNKDSAVYDQTFLSPDEVDDEWLSKVWRQSDEVFARKCAESA